MPSFTGTAREPVPEWSAEVEAWENLEGHDGLADTVLIVNGDTQHCHSNFQRQLLVPHEPSVLPRKLPEILSQPAAQTTILDYFTKTASPPSASPSGSPKSTLQPAKATTKATKKKATKPTIARATQSSAVPIRILDDSEEERANGDEKSAEVSVDATLLVSLESSEDYSNDNANYCNDLLKDKNNKKDGLEDRESLNEIASASNTSMSMNARKNGKLQLDGRNETESNRDNDGSGDIWLDPSILFNKKRKVAHTNEKT
jgi:hypothetical protein